MTEDAEKKIVRALNQNSRKSFREIAKDIGISAPAVIDKVKKLEEVKEEIDYWLDVENQ